MKLGELLAARREYLDLSQQDVAAAIGTNKSTISRYETGDISNMRRDRIYKLANVLDLSTKVIMNWQDDFFINNWEPDVYDLFLHADIPGKIGYAKVYGIDFSFINDFFAWIYPDSAQKGNDTVCGYGAISKTKQEMINYILDLPDEAVDRLHKIALAALER